MRKWVPWFGLLLVLPALACSFSVGMGDETPEATEPGLPTEVPPSKAAPTSTLPLELPTPVPPTPASPSARGLRLYDLFFASGVDSEGAPQDIATQFSQGAAIVYAFLSYEGMTDGTACESVWYLDGDEVDRDSFTWNHGASGGPVWIANVKKEGGLPAGAYDWELYVDGQLAAGGEFTLLVESPVLFEDDFSDPSSGWPEEESDIRRAGYRDGYYFITVLEGTAWSWPGITHADVVVEVEATQAYAGPGNDNSYGVRCRLQTGGDGYFMRISGDGYYSIVKRVDDEYEYLVDWTASDAIRQGNSTNLIRAVCDGPSLVLEVNGQVLGEATDSTFTEGDVGFAVATYEDAPTEVHFDNLVVSRPAP